MKLSNFFKGSMLDVLGDKFEINPDYAEKLKKRIKAELMAQREADIRPAVDTFFGMKVVENDQIPPGEIHIKDNKGKTLQILKVPTSA